MDENEATTVKIYCGVTGKGHRAKGVLITVFRYTGEGWSENIHGTWRRRHLTPWDENTPGSHEMLLHDRRPTRHESSELYPGSEDAKALRAVYELACPVCSPERTPATRKTRSEGGDALALREPVLFIALDQFRRAEISSITLPMLRAIVQDIAQDA